MSCVVFLERRGALLFGGGVNVMTYFPFCTEEGNGLTSGVYIDYQIAIPLGRLDQNIELVYSLVAFLRTLFKGDVPFQKLVKQFLHRTC
jgi:hypothetical protein